MHLRRTRAAALLVLGIAAAAWLAACGGGARDSLPGNPSDPGRRVFAEHCAACHAASAEKRVGPGLAGLFGARGPALPDGVDYGGRLPNGAERTDANVAAWIRGGGQGQIGRMPGVPLSDQEMEDLLQYIKTLGAPG